MSLSKIFNKFKEKKTAIRQHTESPETKHSGAEHKAPIWTKLVCQIKTSKMEEELLLQKELMHNIKVWQIPFSQHNLCVYAGFLKRTYNSNKK